MTHPGSLIPCRAPEMRRFKAVGLASTGRRISIEYEAHVSTIENQSQEAARLPGAQQQQERQGHSGQPPSHRPQTPDPGLIPVPTAPQRLALGRDRRIRCSRDFVRLRQVGRRLAHGCLIANWVAVSAESQSRLGVITSRKVGNAVVRNRARRLLRESFRRHQLEFAAPVDIVLVARPSIAGKTFAEVERVFLSAIRKAGLLKTGV